MKYLILILFCASILKGEIIFQKGPPCPLPDSLQDEGPIPFNITSDPLLSIWEGSQITNLFMDGISLLSYDLINDHQNLKHIWEMNIPHLTGKANYAMNGYVDGRPLREETLPSGDFTGFGIGNFSIENFHAQMNITLTMNLKGIFQFSELEFTNLDFSAVNIDLGNDFLINGVAVDWKAWSENFKYNFDLDFENYRVEVTSKIRNAVNSFLRQIRFDLQVYLNLLEYLTGDRECEPPTTTTSTTTQATTEDPHACNETAEYRAIDCHNYYSCIDYTYKRYFTCPEEDGLAFNPELGMCDRMENVEGCINCGIAYRPDYENCKNYFFCPDICREGLCELRSCPDDLVYSIDFYGDDSGVQQCALPEKAVCAEK